jgi:hypothetical protein
MFSAMRRHVHLSPATVIAGLALVFAMSGGAYAAKKYLITSTKQISPSVLKQLQGKAGAGGAAGAPGAQGPAGPVGPAGSVGARGETGPAGEKGEKGAAGATGAKGATGATGAKGATGATGTTGFTETLPGGKTETGTWSISAYNVPAEKELFDSISFPIPLEEGSEHSFVLSSEEIEKKEGPGFAAGCTGTVIHPSAPEGTLCFYGEREVHAENAFLIGTIFGGGSGYQPSGTTLVAFTTENGASYDGKGSWAVTAPTNP